MSTGIPARRLVDDGFDQSGWITGLAMLAGVVMIVLGGWRPLAGSAALVRDEVYVGTPNYIFAFDLTGWGWLHLLLGIVVAVAGVAVLRGLAWGRRVGIGAASSMHYRELHVPSALSVVVDPGQRFPCWGRVGVLCLSGRAGVSSVDRVRHRVIGDDDDTGRG